MTIMIIIITGSLRLNTALLNNYRKILFSKKKEEKKTTVISTSFRKTGLAWCFILREKKKDLWLPICYQKLFVVSISVLCFQIFTVNFMTKKGLTYAFSIPNWMFGRKLIIKKKKKKKVVSLFFTCFKLLIFHKNAEKISENFNKRNLLKTYIKTTYPSFAYFAAVWTTEKWKYSSFISNQWLE